MKKQYFKRGEEIIKEGTLSDCAYIIDSGSVKISKTLSTGEVKTLGTLQENEIFGEMGLIDNLPRSANVVALEDCSVSVMTQETFDSLSKNNPGALMPVLKVLANRLRKTLDSIEDLERSNNFI